MKIGYIAANLQLVKRNKQWLQAPYTSRLHKAKFYSDIVVSYSRLLSQRRKSITYLGKKFEYDNTATPLNLQSYPFEVGQWILGNMDKKPSTVLDIGANIGQFGCTIASILPGTKVDSFEPNPDVFDMLKTNAVYYPNLRAYNFGLSPASVDQMYYEPTRSAVGSMFEENAGTIGKLKKVSISTVDDPSKKTKRKKYDLIKIDVEGYEYSVLDCLKNISTKYLYIELSGEARKKDYTHAAMFRKIEQTFGPFDICYASGHGRFDPTLDTLLKFTDQ